MEMRFLLDTDIFIYIRQKRPEEVSRRFSKLHPGEAAISVITLENFCMAPPRVSAAQRP